VVTRAGVTDVVGVLGQGRPVLLLGGRGDLFREEARGWEGLLHVVDAVQGSEVPYDAVLVRPDGYVAWSPGGGGLAEALEAYFGPPGRRPGGPGDREGESVS
jgi:monooxygenase